MGMWPLKSEAGVLPTLLRGDERPWERWVFGLGMLGVLGVFFAMMACFNVAAHPGVDQNGYLVGGKILAQRGTAGLSVIDPDTGQVDPYQFVGRMWIGADLGTDRERYYPKYPPGLPLLVAIGWWLGLGPAFAYWINPVCMTLGLGATFLVMRMLAGSGPALLVTAVLASSPAVMGLTTNPNSHAGALCFVTWGMYFALQWSRGGGWGRAIGAGLCLGMAVTFRYTEGLLVLPAALAVLFGLSWRRLRSYLEMASMGAAWLAVVGAMVAYNYACFGSLTGYDPTNESTGFRIEYFYDNWATMLRALDGPGLFMLFPIAVAGMVGLLLWQWRMGLIMAAWIVPSVLLYTAYYWAPSPEGLGYTRFFVTQFPALGACAAAAGAMAIDATQRLRAAGQGATATRMGAAGWTLGGGVVAAIAVLVNTQAGLVQIEMDQINRLALQDQARRILDQAPPGSVIISRNQSLLHHLQFVGDYKLYTGEQFDASAVRRLPVSDEDMAEPQGLQPQRRVALYERLKDMDQRALTAEHQRLVDDAFADGRRVFVAQPWRQLTGRDAQQFGLWRILPTDRYDTKLAVTWERQTIGRLADQAEQDRRVPRFRWAGPRPPQRGGGGGERGMLVEVFPVARPDATQQAQR
jgi:hypothetical protein